MSARSAVTQVQHLFLTFQENYMQTANLFLALFLTITIGFGALAACFPRAEWAETGPAPLPRDRRPFTRKALRRMLRRK